MNIIMKVHELELEVVRNAATYKDFAKMCGVSYKTLHRALNGQPIAIQSYKKIAKLLNADDNRLLESVVFTRKSEDVR